jgi:hypothetical protein
MKYYRDLIVLGSHILFGLYLQILYPSNSDKHNSLIFHGFQNKSHTFLATSSSVSSRSPARRIEYKDKFVLFFGFDRAHNYKKCIVYH